MMGSLCRDNIFYRVALANMPLRLFDYFVPQRLEPTYFGIRCASRVWAQVITYDDIKQLQVG